jgi:hypothetical protein
MTLVRVKNLRALRRQVPRQLLQLSNAALAR